MVSMIRMGTKVIVILVVFIWAGFVHAEQTELKATTFFSSDYKEARNKFLDASTAVGAKIKSFENPNAGHKGEALYTDIASIGTNDAKYILVLGSGTHGVEGFAGSAIQTGLLREGIASNLIPSMGIVMIHAINPYGFAHLRRFNEANVDLNRNFVDHSEDHPKNDGYRQLADAITPKTQSFWENTKSLLKIFWFRFRNGKEDLKQAISGGQYSHPQGLFYGGQSETWSNKTIRSIIRGYLSKAERIVFIDFHTGLGAYGKAEVIMNVPQESPSYKRAMEWWGNRVKTTVSGEAVSVHIHGPLKLAVPKMLPESEVTSVSLEFGTFSRMKVFWALRAENWFYHYGNKNHPDAGEIKADLLRVFYPDEADWKLQVWEQGKEVVDQALANLR